MSRNNPNFSSESGSSQGLTSTDSASGSVSEQKERTILVLFAADKADLEESTVCVLKLAATIRWRKVPNMLIELTVEVDIIDLGPITVTENSQTDE
mmetsp:Transcript_16156/g.18893  ORF Transcript_16156/g.18893 Transcript_16156/m.18893 type:complete len:96 (-) Transcript_16156:64-351(-)